MPGPIELERHVNAPAEVVWQVITDIENAPQTISGIESVQVLDGQVFEVGLRWAETRVMFGRSATEEMTVTAIDPGRSYTTSSDHDKVHYTSTLSVTPDGHDASVVRMHFAAKTSGFLNKTLGAVVGAVMLSSTRKLMARDLADIAAAAEAQR